MKNDWKNEACRIYSFLLRLFLMQVFSQGKMQGYNNFLDMETN